MFKYYFEQVQNVAVWPVISLSIFFGFFILLLWWLTKVDGGYINRMKNLPLDDEKDPATSSGYKKKLIALALGLTLPEIALSQAAETTWDQETVFLWVMILVIIMALLVLMVAIYTLNVLQMTLQKPQPVEKADSESWWQQWWDRLNKSVPQEREADVLLDHDYDGIKELDNHLPPWWTALFYLTIVIGVVYMLVYHVFESAPLPAELYEMEMAEAQASRAAILTAESGSETIDENTVTFDDSPSVLENGEKIYQMQCAACHRNDGGGNIGPNLTDEYWVHGGSIQDIYKVIKYGVPQKGMISWEPLLTPVQMRDVSSYILSLVGTAPDNPKGPQGELFSQTTQ